MPDPKSGHNCSICQGNILIAFDKFYCEKCGVQYAKLTYHTSKDKVVCPIRRKNLQNLSSE